MNLLQDSEDASTDRKRIKSQLEKRRRERMKRSLDRLRNMLLQQPQQGAHRVEKAELLEHTVLFLQSSASRAGKPPRACGAGPVKNTFQDGFSSCLQRAACFLSPEVSALRLSAALRPARAYADGNARSFLRALRQKADSRLRAQCEQASGLPCRVHQPEEPNRDEVRPVRRSSKRRPARNSPVSPRLWRPWS